jgi:hypothetical protein
LDGGTITPEQLGGDCATGLGTLLDAAPRAGLDLPCRSGDADLWFAEAPAELERAKALCAACPIKAECLSGALERLGRRDLRARCGDSAQEASRPPEQGRPRPGPRVRRGHVRLTTPPHP